MATIARLMVELGLEDGAFQRGIDSSRAKLDAWGESLRNTGTKLTAGVTTPILAAGGVMVNWASSLEQTLGATEVLWGSNTDTMLAWAQGADRSMGMTQNQALQNANRFNAMFKTIGHGQDVVMDMSQGFTQLSADLSAMWGGSPDEAADAMTSALRGNYEAMDKYNINLTEAMVSQEAMNIAVADGRSEITEADKTQARYNLIMEQSTDAQGQFARETTTTAGRMAIMKARIGNIATAFGTMLLPYVNKALAAFSKFVDWLEKTDSKTRAIILVVAGLAAALGPVLLIIGMLLPGISALVAVIGFLVSPIGLVVLAVAALVAGFIYAYTHFETFRNIVNTVAGVIRDVAVAAFDAFLRALEPVKAQIDTIIDVFQSLGTAIMALVSGDWSAAWEALKSAASSALDAILGQLTLLPSMLLSALNVDLPSLLAKGGEFMTGLWSGITAKFEEVAAWLGTVSTLALTAIGSLSDTLWQKGVDLFVGLGNGITAQWANLSTWLIGTGTRVTSSVGDVLATLWQKGVDLITGLGDGVTTQWGNLKVWLGNLKTYVTNAVGAVSTTLLLKGIDIITGFWNGAVNMWSSVSAWFSGLGGKILSAVGSIGSSLYNAGVSVMQGLWDGMSSKWGEVTSWLSGLNPADWKGPERRDKKMLYEPGLWIMDGLQRGLSEGWGDVTRQLASYTPMIGSASMGTGSGIGGGGQIVQIITLEPGKWAEFLADAQAGGQFARNFANELGMRG